MGKQTTVTTSVVLTDREKRQVADLVKKLVKSAEIVYKVDSSLLGGIRIQAGDWLVDTSLVSQLSQLALTLKK